MYVCMYVCKYAAHPIIRKNENYPEDESCIVYLVWDVFSGDWLCTVPFRDVPVKLAGDFRNHRGN